MLACRMFDRFRPRGCIARRRRELGSDVPNERGRNADVCVRGGGGPGIYACVRFEQFNLFRLPNDVRRRWFSAMQHRELG